MQNNQPIEPARFNTAENIRPAEFRPLPAGGIKTKRRRAGIGLAAVAVLIFAGIIWFIFTAKSVYIDVKPAAADIDIKGGLHIRLADRFLMTSGNYRIAIRYPRYYPFEQKLTIGRKQNQQYSFQLQPLPGHLQIHTVPANNVQVWIDNNLKGKAPLEVRNLSQGTHTLELVADRYLPFSKTVNIEGLDKEQKLNVKLTPAWGDVSFSTQPPGADVFVDNEDLGRTPVTPGILQGDHNVRIKLEGYKAWTGTINVTANEAMTVPAITLEPADAEVSLETVPARANVTVAGQYAGQTPITVALSPGETADIRFFKEGYQRTRRSLKIKSGQKQHLRIVLQPELTPVQFSSTPPDAELYIDGLLRGRASQTLKLTTRIHTIEIKHAGYVDYKASIKPRLGIQQQVIANLETIEQAKQEAIKPIITTAAGQKLKLFYPSGFTMGASRREAGRRANETLRNVTLNRPFYLSLYEITNDQFRAFDNSHSSGDVQGNSLNGGSQPVVNVTWDQAARYCNWLSKQDSLPNFYIEENGKITGFNRNATGYRLPTEAEWAWTARVVGRQQVLKYPWGDEMPPLKGSGNYADHSAANLLGNIVSGYNDGYIVTAPVGSFVPNSKGIFDLGGNVAEWVHDYYNVSIMAVNKNEINPMGPDTGDYHVIRGSSWRHGTITELRLSYRDYGDKARDDVGFRIARFLDHE